MKQINFPSRGQTAYGWAHVPQGAEKVPAIVMCHGFCGNAAEASRLFVEFANEAEKQGFYVIRFDCLGSGNSNLDFSEFTYISGWAEDILNAVKFAAAQPEVDPDRIGIVGLSMGGAASALAGRDTSVRAVGLWSPALQAESVFRGITGDEEWERLAAGSYVLDSVFAGCKYKIRSRFVEDILSLDIPGALGTYGKKPVMLLQGTEDIFVAPEGTRRVKETYPDIIEYHLVEGEDHDLTFKREIDFTLTLDFFRKAL